MSYPDKPFYLIAAAFCALSLMARTVPAAVTPGPPQSFQPRTFEADVHNGETIGWQQVRRVSVTCGTNAFDFVAPYGLRMSANPDKVALASTDSTYVLAFRILGTVAEQNPGNTASRREFLLNQFPGAKVMEEFYKTAAGRNGPAFELQVRIAGGAERAVCVALIPCAAGVLEFSLNADPAKASEARTAFDSILRTFRSNERGKLATIVPVPDNS